MIKIPLMLVFLFATLYSQKSSMDPRFGIDSRRVSEFPWWRSYNNEQNTRPQMPDDEFRMFTLMKIDDPERPPENGGDWCDIASDHVLDDPFGVDCYLNSRSKQKADFPTVWETPSVKTKLKKSRNGTGS